MEEGNEDNSMDYLMEPPRDLHQIYMRLRQSLSKAPTFYKIYLTLFSLIDIGAQLLPDRYGKLLEEVELTLESDDSYPQKRQVEKDGNEYRLSSDGTGLIVVRNEEITYGLKEAIEQQSCHIIPRLKKLDNKVFRVLVANGVIEKKQSILEDLLISQTIKELNEAIQNKEGE